MSNWANGARDTINEQAARIESLEAEVEWLREEVHIRAGAVGLQARIDRALGLLDKYDVGACEEEFRAALTGESK